MLHRLDPVRQQVEQLESVVEDAVRDRSARSDQHVLVSLHIERPVERRAAGQRLQVRVAIQLPVVSRANIAPMILVKPGERIVEVRVPVDRLGKLERNTALALLRRLRQRVVTHDVGAFRFRLAYVGAVGVVALERMNTIRGV